MELVVVVAQLVFSFLPSSLPPLLPYVLPVLQKEEQSDRERWQHLADLADFALAMKVTLMNINYQSFNNFMLRIGASSLLPVDVFEYSSSRDHISSD